MPEASSLLPTYAQMKERRIIAEHANINPKGGPVLAFFNAEENHARTRVYAVCIMVMQDGRPLVTFAAHTDYGPLSKGHDHMMDSGPQKLLPERISDTRLHLPAQWVLAKATALFCIHLLDNRLDDDLHHVPVHFIDLNNQRPTTVEFLKGSQFNAALLPNSKLSVADNEKLDFPPEYLWGFHAVLFGMGVFNEWRTRPQYGGPFNIADRMDASVTWFCEKFKARRPQLSTLGL